MASPPKRRSSLSDVISADGVKSFLCPITNRVMRDPVICVGDGHSYEREAITEWFGTGNRSSPLTNGELSALEIKLVTNHTVSSRHQTYSCLTK